MRFVAGPLPCSASTPGGLFAPMLTRGSISGTMFGRLVQVVVPDLGGEVAVAMANVGMSALFAAVVTAMALTSPPVYDSRRAMLVDSPPGCG